MMVVLSFILLTGCATVETNQSSDEAQGEKNPAVHLETNVELKQLEDHIVFDLTLTNVGSEDVELLFSSGQQYEITVKDENNQDVYRYSEGKMYTQALETKVIKTGEKINWNVEWDQKEEGQFLPNGEYTVTAEVLAKPSDETITIDKEQFQHTISMSIDDIIIENLENKAFRNLKVEGELGQYSVTGEARVFEAVFGYSVSDGHKYYIEEFIQIENGAPSWAPFTIEISISEDQLPVNGTVMLELYEESAKDGSKVNQLFVPLERIIK